MAKNDIYDNERKFNNFKDNLNTYLEQPIGKSRRKYWIKNKANINHFKRLFEKFEARDTSYIRRNTLCGVFMIINNVLNKDLATATREDIDKVMAFSNTIHNTIKSKSSFPLDTKFLWRQLFPERDNKNRIDDTITPYPVRHLTGKVDKSKQVLRNDKFSLDEFEKLVQSFSDDIRMQCLLTISLESLARPQELLQRKIKDVEIKTNYAKIYISDYGKEGTGFLRVIDSYFYLAKWFNKHPMKHNPEAYLFINTGRRNRYSQMTPYAANKLISERCKKLGIHKNITLYSLKRNGVTMMRLMGKSDLEIQHTARWTSNKQLKTYDMSSQEESFRKELIERGIITARKDEKGFKPSSKKCFFCEAINGIAETICNNCKRPLEKEVVEKELEEKDREVDNLRKEMEEFKENLFEDFKKKFKTDIIKEIKREK